MPPSSARPAAAPAPVPSSAAAPPAAPLLPLAFAALALGLLLGLQPVTTDVYLPALPALRADLGAGMAATQLTMSAVLLAFGIGQLVWGPVADRLGRRPVLLAGLALHLVASLGATVAPSVEWLVAARAAQGAGMAAAVVVARAIVRDLYEPLEGARVMSIALSGLGVLAASGPALGGLLTAQFGWRAALASVALFSALTLAFVALRLPETIRQRNPRATAPGPLLANWRRIAADRTFMAWTALSSSTYAGLYTVLAGSSFVYIGALGLSPAAYGLVMASGALAYLAGTVACRRGIARRGLPATVRLAGALSALGGVAALALVAGGAPAAIGFWALLLPQWVYLFAHGIHQPCSQTGAVGPFPTMAGAASALAGCALALTAVAVGAWLGGRFVNLAGGALLPYAATLAAFGLVTGWIATTRVQRLPAPAATAAAAGPR